MGENSLDLVFQGPLESLFPEEQEQNINSAGEAHTRPP